jgi:2-polyprenyl-3-methyl-5-hydroxy-6-metoxy-1,4-benzoquinol methylase
MLRNPNNRSQKFSYNVKTIQSYNKHISEYISGTSHKAHPAINAWIDASLAYLAKGSKVLELGSGFGRDADYIESKGFIVDRTDASEGFIDYLQKNGKSARLLNVLTDSYGESYDMVFANAVLLHFRPKDVNKILSRAKASLKSNGILAFSIKEGIGEAWITQKVPAPRFFHFFDLTSIDRIVAQNGLKRLSATTAKTKKDVWIHVIAQK